MQNLKDAKCGKAFVSMQPHFERQKESAGNQLCCEIIKRRRLIIILQMKIFPQGAMIMLQKGDVADRIYPDERSSLMRGDGGWERHQMSVVKANNKRGRKETENKKTLLKLSCLLSSV